MFQRQSPSIPKQHQIRWQRQKPSRTTKKSLKSLERALPTNYNSEYDRRKRHYQTKHGQYNVDYDRGKNSYHPTVEDDTSTDSGFEKADKGRVTNRQMKLQEKFDKPRIQNPEGQKKLLKEHASRKTTNSLRSVLSGLENLATQPNARMIDEFIAEHDHSTLRGPRVTMTPIELACKKTELEEREAARLESNVKKKLCELRITPGRATLATQDGVDTSQASSAYTTPRTTTSASDEMEMEERNKKPFVKSSRREFEDKNEVYTLGGGSKCVQGLLYLHLIPHGSVRCFGHNDAKFPAPADLINYATWRHT